MKTVKYWCKAYKYEILTFVAAVLLLWVQQDLWISLLINFVAVVIIIALRMRERAFYFISLEKRNDKDCWMGVGDFNYSITHKCFNVGHCDPGYLYSKALTWSNYKSEYDFKIINGALGSIVRAINLSNYIMLQISPKGINPHIRVNGAWYIETAVKANLVFDNLSALSLDQWYKCQICCENDSITIRIFDSSKKIFDRDWKIAKGYLNFPFKENEADSNPKQIPLAINLEYGTIGFRNCGSERALVKNLLIEKLS